MQEEDWEWVVVLWFKLANLVGHRLPFSFSHQGNWGLCELIELQCTVSSDWA